MHFCQKGEMMDCLKAEIQTGRLVSISSNWRVFQRASCELARGNSSVEVNIFIL